MRVEVAYVAPGVDARVAVEVAAGAVVADAVAASGVLERLALDPASLAFAIHGQRARADTPLEDGDRVELLRELVADAKAARRRRAADHPLPRPAARVKRRRA